MNPFYEFQMYVQTVGGYTVFFTTLFAVVGIAVTVFVLFAPEEWHFWKPKKKPTSIPTSKKDETKKDETKKDETKKDERFPEADDFVIYEDYCLADGHDIKVEDEMTVESAFAKCRDLEKEGCVGFCHKGGRTNGKVQIVFKSKWEHTNGKACTSYFLKKAKNWMVCNTNPDHPVEQTSLRSEAKDKTEWVPGAAANGRIVEDAQVAPEGEYRKVQFENDFGHVEGWIHYENLREVVELKEVVEVRDGKKWFKATVEQIELGVVYAKRKKDWIKWPCKPHLKNRWGTTFGWDEMRKVKSD